MIPLEFGILGLGSGAIYAILGLGLVLIYRGSGVVNFAQSAMAMFCAYWFVDLTQNFQLNPWLAFLVATVVGAGLGLLTRVIVMRPLTHASQLARLAATLGIVIILQGLATIKWGDSAFVVKNILPTNIWRIGTLIIPQDIVILAFIAVGITMLLWAFSARTLFGLAITAVAENEQSAAVAGWNPARIASINWIICGALAGASGVLVTPLVGLSPTSLTLVIIPALAAAMIGGFSNYPLTLGGGLLIGIVQAEISHYANLTGLNDLIPLTAVFVVLMFSGRSLPLRGYVGDRLPGVGSGRLRPWFVVSTFILLCVLMLTVFSTTVVVALTATFIVAILMQSAVVLTGYAGQVSLAVYGLAGLGAFVTGRLVAFAHWPLELALLAGLISAPLIGVALALPALRTRGATLAVITLAIGLALQSVIFENYSLSGVNGTYVGGFHLFGFSLNPITQPDRYGIFCLVVLIGTSVLVSRVRRGRVGGRLIAIREGERAASAIGVSVFGAKLSAFAIAAFVATIGGILLGFSNYTIVYSQFDPISSVQLLCLAVVGGIGYLSGSLLGACLAGGTIGALIIQSIFGEGAGNWLAVAGGCILILILIRNPDGLLPENVRVISKLTSRFIRHDPMDGTSKSITDVQFEPADPFASVQLDVRNLSIQYGGVKAVTDVSLSVRGGEVVGLVGPNGAGKTSLFDGISGFAKLTQGDALLDGQPIHGQSPARRARAGLGRTFQATELFDGVTVRENLRIAAEAALSNKWQLHASNPFGRGQRAKAEAVVDRLAHEFELVPYLDQLPDTLPFGSRRLVAIARTMATDPRVLLLDEPAAGLDDEETQELGRYVRRVASSRGLAVLVIEHDLGFVMKYCDKIAVLDFGRKIAEGSPDEIRRNPEVRAAYLGIAEEDIDAHPTPPSDGRVGASKKVESPRGAGSSAVLKVTGLKLGYGPLTVVRSVDLTVDAGEIVALLGPNGSGKTTTLLGIVGALPARAGTVEFAGSTTNAPLHRRVNGGLAFISESGGLAHRLTVRENLRLAHVSEDRVVDFFPVLGDLIGRKVATLSGGEQRMVAVARALARDPAVLVVDELSQGLAPLIVERILEAIETAAANGLGVLIVEQHVHQILKVAHRACVMRRGEIQVSGLSSELSGSLDQLEVEYLGGGDIVDPESPLIPDNTNWTEEGSKRGKSPRPE